MKKTFLITSLFFSNQLFADIQKEICDQVIEASASDYSRSGIPANSVCFDIKEEKYSQKSCVLKIEDTKATLTANIKKQTTFTIGKLMTFGGGGPLPGVGAPTTCAYGVAPLYKAPPLPLELLIECTFSSNFKWFCGYKRVNNLRADWYQEDILKNLTRYLEDEL